MRYSFFFFQAEDGIRDYKVTGVQTCALPISEGPARLGPQRLRERAGPARATARGALVQLLHLGLQGAARVVERLLARGQGVHRAHGPGRSVQARLPPGHGRSEEHTSELQSPCNL